MLGFLRKPFIFRPVRSGELIRETTMSLKKLTSQPVMK